jgi:hypothetical protein
MNIHQIDKTKLGGKHNKYVDSFQTYYYAIIMLIMKDVF